MDVKEGNGIEKNKSSFGSCSVAFKVDKFNCYEFAIKLPAASNTLSRFHGGELLNADRVVPRGS